MYGNFFPDLETHLEVFWNLLEIVAKLVRRGWAVEGGIIADGAKERFAVVAVLAILA
jgi:hypothetical protein